jgi:hypothetical protein
MEYTIRTGLPSCAGRSAPCVGVMQWRRWTTLRSSSSQCGSRQLVIRHAIETAEDDAQRSAHVQYLLHVGAASRPPLPATPIPRVIVQFWHDSAAVPSDVSECLDSWGPLIECGFRHVLFDNDSARAFISRSLGRTHTAAFDRCRHPAMRCDYFRLCWMLLQGGFYVDADDWYLGVSCDELFVDATMKVQPMCYDLSTNTMVPVALFLNEGQLSPEWIFYVNNNPLIAPRGHPVIRLALERATRLLLCPTPATDIQSTTGPGNLTASLVRHSVDRGDGQQPDFTFLTEWDAISVSRWPLSYRSDERNWRLWQPTE